MEGGNGPEFLKPLHEKTDKGFSEARDARVREGKGMDDSQVVKSQPVVRHGKSNRAARIASSQRVKLLTAHEKNAQAMIELVKTLGLLTQGSIRQEEQLMVEIRARHKLQEQLLNALVLESRGLLKEDALSKELQDLIK